jgi:hypothetical protein
MKKIAFSTWCTDNYVEKVGLDGLKKSLAYFHPDIPLYVYDSKETEGLKRLYGSLPSNFMMPATCLELTEKYDMVIHIDADSTVTGPLTELLECDAEIVGVRNNNSYGKAGCHAGITISNIPVFEFLNAGLVGSNGKRFIEDWKVACQDIGHQLEGGEQDVLNLMFQSKHYTTKILDPLVTNVSYGTGSNSWGTDTHWDSWKELYVEDDKLMLDDPNTKKSMEIKVLHQAGGSASVYPMRPWMDSLFTDEVKEYFRKITT